MMLSIQMKGYLALNDAFSILNMYPANYNNTALMIERQTQQSQVYGEYTCRVKIPNSINLENCYDESVPFGFMPHGDVNIQCAENHYSLQSSFECSSTNPPGE